MSNYNTRKASYAGRMETLERRLVRANKQGAARVTASARIRKAV